MRIRYTVPVKQKMRVRNHWPFSWLGGEFRLLETEGFITAIQISFVGQPSSLAPDFTPTPGGATKATITNHDSLLPIVRQRLRRGLAYIQCQFQLELALDRMRAEYQPESDAERGESKLLGFSRGGESPPLALTYDFITRAMMVSDGSDDPELIAGFLMSARRALFEGSFISSYRYSFLMFETLFGGGQFRNKALKTRLKASPEFCRAVEITWKSYLFRPRAGGAETQRILRSATSTDPLIDHLVEMRGFYFHGQGKHPNAWRPDKPEEAETLADFAVGIAQILGSEAARPMFEPHLSQLHFESAQRAGATIVLTVDFKFREPELTFDQNGQMNFNIPGPEPTAGMAAEVAREFLHNFTQHAPDSVLREARCTTGPNQREVFIMKFYVE